MVKVIEWGVIPTRSPVAKKDGTDGHLGFFRFTAKNVVYPGEFRTPVTKGPLQARAILRQTMENLGLKVPKELKKPVRT